MLHDAFYVFVGYLPWVSLLIAALFVLRKYSNRISARFFRAAWLIVALRCALPIPVAFSRIEPLVQVELPATLTQPRAGLEAMAGIAPPPAASVAAVARGINAGQTNGTPFSLVSLAVCLWLIGAAAVIIWYALCYITFLVRLRRTRLRADARICTHAAVVWGKRIPVYTTPLLGSPSLVGLGRPVIYLPQGLVLPDSALQLVLNHERCHARSGDIFAKLLLTLACAVCWMNPLVWWMRRTAEDDMERACDEAMLRGQDKKYCQLYGNAILQTLRLGCKAPVFSTSFAGTAHALKERFQAMFTIAKKKNARTLLATLTAAVLLASVLVACRSADVSPANAPSDAQSQPLAPTASEPDGAPDTESVVLSETALTEWATFTGRLMITKDGTEGVTDVDLFLPLTEFERADPSETGGLDFVTNAGTPVNAVAQGTIHVVTLENGDKVVEIDHGNGLVSRYEGVGTLWVKDGDGIKAGNYAFGYVGGTKDGTQAKLHFELLLDGQKTYLSVGNAQPQPQPTPQPQSTSQTAEQSDGTFVDPLQGKGTKFTTMFSIDDTKHRGVDIAAPYDTPVVAAQAGVVVVAEFDYSEGNHVEIDHGSGLHTLYSHMASFSVKQGESVTAGQVIGAVGSTGNSTGNHLHLEVSQEGTLQDPVQLIAFPDAYAKEDGAKNE